MNKIWILMLLPAFMMACGKSDKKQDEGKQRLRPVKYVTLSYGQDNDRRTFVGQSQAEKEVNMSFRVSGKVASIRVKEGDRVKKGDMIASLDPKDLRLKLDQEKSAMNQAKVQYSTAASELDRVKDLYEKNSASLSDYENAQNSFASSRATYEEKVKSVNLAERQLSYTRLIAPIDGVITKKDVDVNEVIQSGSTVVELSSEGQLQVRVGVPDNYIGKVRVGQEAQVEFSSIKGMDFKGSVAEISYSKNVGSTFPVNVNIINPDSRLRIGMSAKVTFAPAPSSDDHILYVPADAVAQGQDGKDYVFVLDVTNNEAVVKKQVVDLGELTDSGFRVLGGLKEGDKVVVAGIVNLSEGMRVAVPMSKK